VIAEHEDILFRNYKFVFVTKNQRLHRDLVLQTMSIITILAGTENKGTVPMIRPKPANYLNNRDYGVNDESLGCSIALCFLHRVRLH
jgi:hypothetical protein